jgi:sterol desaturase/sphingolipid hydroxylase (fatty acid hydroxylase superfamily)
MLEPINASLIHFICYWTMVYIYDKKVPKKSLITSSISSFKNQIFYTFPLTFMFFKYYPVIHDDILISLCYLPLIVSISDIYFYITHKPLHSKLLFHLHKFHHTGEIHVAKSLDANGFEHIFGNLGSFMSGPILLWYNGLIINIYVLNLWIAIATLNTCVSHSNKQCWLDNGDHLNHHKYYKYNYGFGFYIVDKLTGTYKYFIHKRDLSE